MRDPVQRRHMLLSPITLLLPLLLLLLLLQLPAAALLTALCCASANPSLQACLTAAGIRQPTPGHKSRRQRTGTVEWARGLNTHPCPCQRVSSALFKSSCLLSLLYAVQCTACCYRFCKFWSAHTRCNSVPFDGNHPATFLRWV